jgi:hypothetical protein
MANRKTVIKIVCIAVLLFSLLYLASCAKKTLTRVEPVKRGKPGEEVVIERSDTKMPKWVYDQEFQVIKEKRQKFVVVLSDVQHKERRAAERIAEGDLKKRVAEGVKTLVNSQFKEALTGTEQTYSQRFESYVVTVANNVPVVGLIVTDTYWEKVQRFKTKKEVEYFYRVVKRARMPYDHYVNSRNKAWQDVLRGIEDEREREELSKLIESMKLGDEV